MDLCSVKRIEKIWEKFGARFVRRILSPSEVDMLDGVPTPAFIAGHFAAKEAVSKALGCGIGSKLSFQDVTVIHSEEGQPQVVLSDKAQKKFEGIGFHLTLTKERGMVGATAIAMLNAEVEPYEQ